jgi:hypothetical protein
LKNNSGPQVAKETIRRGYFIAVIGLVVGLLLSLEHPSRIPGQMLAGSYIFWASWHGVGLVKPFLLKLFDFKGVHLKARNTADLFRKNIEIKFYHWIIIFITGFTVGLVGGAIIRQVHLMLQAYNKNK